MTMLDRMRRHKAWLKWSLGVVVLTFVLLYVPQFLRGADVMGANETIASVDGRPITGATYQQLYLQQVAQIRSQYGDIDEQMLRQLGVGQRIVQRLVSQQAVLIEAGRLGLTVSDGELKERLVRLPMFQNGGQFVGESVYRQMLATARPPVTPRDFERDLRDSLISEKLQNAVTGWIRVSDGDIEQEYRRRNEKIKVDVAIFSADQFTSAVAVTDADLAQHFSANQERYRVGEKRRVRYLSIDAEALRSKMTATPAEVEQRYKDTIQTFSTPEQLRASHILFHTQGKDEAAVQKIAESVLAKVKAGGDFAALAKQYSDDTVSKVNGGDLDYFSRGAMVKEFDDVAWTLQPGQVSGLVKTPFGVHIIKVTGKRAATTKSLNDARAQIEDGLKFEKARAEAARIATDVAPTVKQPADLDRVAKEHGLTVGDSGLFVREEPLAGLGFAPAVASEAFALELNKVSGSLQTNTGFAFIALTEIKPTYLPKLEEVAAKVREDVVRTKALELAQRKAATVAQSGRGNFAAAVKAAGGTLKSTDFIARGAALPDIGVNEKVDQAAFALKTGDVSAPISTDTAMVVVQVKDKQDIVPTGLEADRENLRAELTQQRAGAFFESYMAKARTKMKITYNEAAISALLGTAN